MRANLADIARVANLDPAKALTEPVGDLSDYEIFHNFVLVATYIAPEKIGSIIVTDRRKEEDRFQGKVGLVLKCGPMAFKDDAAARFGGIEIKPGDWVLYRPADGYEMFIKDRRTVNDGVPVRLIEDTLIKGRVSDPSLIY